MSFVVEDGTIVPNANSYATIAAADAYFLERGVTAWAGVDSLKQGWLIQATDYVELRFASRFLGDKVDAATQSLSWPRTGVDGYDITEIPETLKRAIYEYANRARVAPLAPDPVVDATNRVAKAKRTKVGPIETDLSYDSGSGSVVKFKAYPAADALLSSIISPSGANRAVR
jgi:hypothetical protein